MKRVYITSKDWGEYHKRLGRNECQVVTSLPYVFPDGNICLSGAEDLPSENVRYETFQTKITDLWPKYDVDQCSQFGRDNGDVGSIVAAEQIVVTCDWPKTQYEKAKWIARMLVNEWTAEKVAENTTRLDAVQFELEMVQAQALRMKEETEKIRQLVEQQLRSIDRNIALAINALRNSNGASELRRQVKIRLRKWVGGKSLGRLEKSLRKHLALLLTRCIKSLISIRRTDFSHVEAILGKFWMSMFFVYPPEDEKHAVFLTAVRASSAMLIKEAPVILNQLGYGFGKRSLHSNNFKFGFI